MQDLSSGNYTLQIELERLIQSSQVAFAVEGAIGQIPNRMASLAGAELKMEENIRTFTMSVTTLQNIIM